MGNPAASEAKTKTDTPKFIQFPYSQPAPEAGALDFPVPDSRAPSPAAAMNTLLRLRPSSIPLASLLRRVYILSNHVFTCSVACRYLMLEVS